MDTERIRRESNKVAVRLGFPINPSLPVFEEAVAIRSKEEILDRLLSLHPVVACSYGWDKNAAQSWLKQEKIWGSLTPLERQFLAANEGDSATFQVQVEGLWALAWTLNYASGKLHFGAYCADDFVKMLPDVKRSESSQAFREKARLRTTEEIVAACDLAYCLHWAIRQAALDGTPSPGRVEPSAIIERRRALEWILHDEDWDEITLDT